MKIFLGRTINDAYHDIMTSLMSYGDYVDGTKELLNAVVIVEEPSLSNMLFYDRPLSMKYALAELEWYWTGNNSCEAIGKHAKKWLSISDDGKTSNSAYGYILFKKYHKNQLEEVIDVLRKDRTSRRAVLNISDPAIDRLHTKDMQCTVALQFFIRNNRLHTTVYMRSNDVYYGLPYDYIFFVSITQYIAKRLNVELGEYVHHAASLHLYDSTKLKTATELCTIDPEPFYDMYEQMKKEASV